MRYRASDAISRPAVRTVPADQGNEMSSNCTIHAQISVALRCLREARFDNDDERILVAETHMNRLLDKLKAPRLLEQTGATSDL